MHVDVLVKKNDNKVTELNYFMKSDTSDLYVSSL